jgi:integrase
VQERLGHATISVTIDTYSHVAPGLKEADAGFDKMMFPRREKEMAEKVY